METRAAIRGFTDASRILERGERIRIERIIVPINANVLVVGVSRVSRISQGMAEDVARLIFSLAGFPWLSFVSRDNRAAEFFDLSARCECHGLCDGEGATFAHRFGGVSKGEPLENDSSRVGSDLLLIRKEHVKLTDSSKRSRGFCRPARSS